ncbi:sigma-w pathway protein ysdB [Lysinibacillus irui]|uniref:Sigma-w pathway protein ysdB n=1 Tax=Lysinibacillus irui TaxID=2998077 RepID=A0AAJ5UTW0_9BACI|nr:MULTISPECIES: sigma-w pathway protein ysdB [Lysinibacillus]MEA0555545.1 sigma-w pathway protein ysdB [Lysinibacillus irui]MEA0564930.1 sigma-w pathway protein ysdB [Lysinibacillus irui]MEA0977130.1 sigma-w pathway protein ysdB [Lysinibacillus irui]MEA1043284.1 sigma-w pathway protein ysdB [Lysinibacillus irui]WDV05847.1 sigma-w pathway protein ysdB [Lysinibacillus irui]
MLPLLIRLAVIALIIYVFYKAIRYITDPKRKLDEAYEKGQYYFYDDVKNVRKNFFISYKGALFEGEKYLGTTEDAFEVVTIFVGARDAATLQGFTKSDFEYLQQEILLNYPSAKINWKQPIEQLMRNTSSS